ncbi:MAG: alpha-galactosidase, partial [Muribaculaceae bacterium]|nr:alpha-galactosidase [Muribaculaceae bacterium]
MLVQAKSIRAGAWTIGVDATTGGVTAAYDGDTLINNSIAGWGRDGMQDRMSDCRDIRVSSSPRVKDDIFENATRVSVTGKIIGKGIVTLDLILNNMAPEMTASLTLEGPVAMGGVNCIVPVCNSNAILFDGTDNRQLFVPYDNDAWVRYSVSEFGRPAPESHEVGAVFDAIGRRGIVYGSIDHDMWKSAVKYSTSSPSRIDSLTLYCGVSSSLTRDVRPHGTVKGLRVSSPRFLIISTPDWRDGLETFADKCNIVAPNLTRNGPRPFGWNSWGDLQTKINFENASQVVNFISENLAGSFHAADSSVVVNLDAFWDFGFTPAQHYEFVNLCRAKGIKPGIYYCPFTDWSKNPDATVSEAPAYKMGELYLTHEGKPLEFDGAYALDPTHPGTRARIEHQLNEFKKWGYEYVKIDFMAHGAYESDSHYDPKAMTGTQAFTAGMQFIDSIAGDDMWINLSIAPLFPASYAQSRRIGCDAWNDINSTEYTLNALTYGWWLDHMYHYNDADHVVFKEVTEGENRARLTSSAITGVFFLGDDFSSTGNEETRNRALSIACNDDINEMARLTKSFRPLRAGNGDRAADIFEGRAGNTVWVALFNYGENDSHLSYNVSELSLDAGDI